LSDPVVQLREFWNARYASAEYAYGTTPNDYLVRQSALIPKGGKVLCLADGEGRNSVYLAKQGFLVTAVDLADEGLAKGRALAKQAGVEVQFVAADVNTFPIEPSAWQGIASIFLHLPDKLRTALHERCLNGLSPGGVFIFEAYSRAQLGRLTGGPKEAHLLPQGQSVRADFPQAAVIDFFDGEREIFEGPLHNGTGAVVQLTAKRPAL
jgi:SAM-dependent methyltransferase